MAFAHHHGVRFSGSKAAMTVAPDGPLEKDRCRRNDLQRRGPTPLGAAMRSIGFPPFFSRCEKYCHNRGMAFAHHCGMAGGPRKATMALPQVLENALCREKGAGSTIRALWGSDGLVCLF